MSRSWVSSRLYRALWTAVAGAVHAVGVVGAFFTVPGEDLAALLLAGILVGATCAMTLWAIEALRLVRVAQVSLGTGVVVLTIFGMANLLGSAGIVLLLAVHVLSPTVLSRLRSRRHTMRPSAAGPSSAAPAETSLDDPPRTSRHSPTAATVPDHVPDEDLWLVWETSLVALKKCRSAEQRAHVVEVRQACLDELERRNPVAVQAWLHDGARPSRPPTRHLSR